MPDFPNLPDGFPGRLEYKEDKWVYFSLAYLYGIPAWVITELPGEWVRIPNRPESYPPIFHNSKLAAAATTAKKPTEWNLPHVAEEHALDIGWLRLRGRDTMLGLAAYLNVSQCATFWLQALVRASIVAQKDMPVPLVQRYLNSCSRVMGPCEKCSREAPVKAANGEWIKGTEFERLVLSKGLEGTKDRKRIYAITQSQQVQNGVLAPNVEAKSFTGGDGEDAEIHRELAKVGGELGVHIIRTVQPELYHHLELHAKLLGYFRPGTMSNVCFGGSQLNVSTPDYLDKLQKGPMDLSDSLGFFGGVHQDEHDSIGAMSVMTVFSKLHAGIGPGLFLFPECYAFVRLPDGFTEDESERSSLLSVLFSGLHWHMGMSPYVSDNTVEIAQDAVRLNHVMYPMSRVMDGNSMLALGAVGQKAINIPPEMYNPTYDHDHKIYSNYLNYAVDGLNIGDRHTVASFMVRQLYNLVFHLWRQANVGPSLNPDVFFSAFSAVDEEGQCITFTDTDLVPVLEHRPDEPEYVHETILARAQAWREWKEHKLRYVAVIPRATYDNRIVDLRKEMGTENPAPVPVTRPGRSQQPKKAPVPSKGKKAKPKPKSKPAKGKKRARAEVEDGMDSDERPAQRARLDLENGDARKVIGHPRRATRVMAVDGPAVDQPSSSAGPSQHGGGMTLRPRGPNPTVSDREDGQSLLYVPLDALMVPPKLSARTADESESEDEDDEDESQEAPVLSPAAQSSGSASAKSYAVALSLFTAAKFQAANQMLRNVASVLQSEDSAARSVSRQLLDGLLDAMESKDSAAACSVGFAVLLQRNWSAQTRYKRDDSLQHLKCTVLRSEIMMMNYYAWLWLDCVPVNYCSRFLSSSAPSAAANDWLGHLAIAVNDGFKSARFTADRRYTASIDFIQRTLRTWLDFPKNSSYVRSLFIRAIISAFGCSDVLLLDGVWDVYQRAESSLLILDDRRRRLPSTHLDPLFHDLRALPVLSQPTLPDACAFAEFLWLCSSSLPPLSSASSCSTPPAPQLTLQPSSSAAPGLEALHCFVINCYGVLDHLLNGKQITHSAPELVLEE
ncbi:uncharacterized protein C8Q71DRAFT_854587 [Rhodofomes roseus]|uniref:Uncharacterized protein n=1 Tax=Rhodofomes roseus TaxID=34475 RepID=A0ABQ8KQ17_9APHY|nr:uncharacterized protein C8Q71DRAFT_854587 [Rhodofomes roseus]KAH9840712.1 hypothetical protein C8Q71DRAFT_854587 [Rhodofomes roseus]